MRHTMRFALTWLMLSSMLLGLAQPVLALTRPTVESALSTGITAVSPETPPPPVEAESKIESYLSKQLQTEEQADFFIWLAQKADLSQAARLSTKEEKGQFVFDALRAHAEQTQKELRAYLDSQGVSYKPFFIANKILVRGGSQALAYTLAARSDVSRLTANHVFQLEEPIISPRAPEETLAIEPNISFVNADLVWALGVTGAGAVLAGNDTGLDWQHPAILDHYRGWDGATADHNYNWWDATGSYPAEPGDGHGHGTHTTGTMVGDDGGSNQIGLAPGARTIHCKNMDDGGYGSDEWFSECFQWDLAPWDLNGNNPRPDLAPDAINNSWGYWGGGVTVFEDEIAALQAAGILVEVSAGNEGPGCTTLRSPGDYSAVLTTGSVNHASGALPGSLTDFSSRGPSLLSADYMPDIMAPGEDIRSSVPGGGYESWGGTSMAGPHVTALVGLMWSANPGLRGMIAETQQILFQTAVPLSGQTGSNCGGDYTVGPNNDWGFGTIDALAAVEAALTFGGTGTLAGTVSDSLTSDLLADVEIHASLSPTMTWKTQTDETGHYSRLVFSGTYTVTGQLYGYYPEEITGITVISGTTTTLDIPMDPAPFYTVTGQVIDAQAGWPLYARIDISGYPGGPVWTDPLSGEYSISLAAGIEYTFNVSAWSEGYQTTSRVVGPLGSPQTEDFNLQADLVACSAPGYAPEFTYFEDFEASNGAYTTTGWTSWEWGVPTSGPGSAHSGTNAWATNLEGDYNDDEYGSLESPDIDLSATLSQVSGGGGGTASLIVTWWQWLQTEAYFDYGSVDVSKDGGASWTRIYSDTGTVNTSWTQYTYYLDSSYAVSNFRIRFNFSSDYSVTEAGFYVDDIGIGMVELPPTYYDEDFEADNGGYATSGVTSWEWGTPLRVPDGSHSGVNAWGTNLSGDYGNDEDGYLTSLAIDLSAAAPTSTGIAGGGPGLDQWLRLSWWQWLQTESGYDFASVEVSNGISWTEMLTGTGIINTEWTETTLFLDPAEYAIANFQVRFRLQSDEVVTYPGFYVDDVSIDLFTSDTPHVPCTLQSGGLVVGNAYDENTSLGLVGATVTGSADSAITQDIGEDPAIEQGFYALFAPAGPQALTASKNGYGSDVQTPTVILSDTIQQDFNLAAGWLAVTPSGLAATLQLGSSTSAGLTVENLGGLAATFQVREGGAQFVPTTLETVIVPANLTTERAALATYLSQYSAEPNLRESFSYTPSALATFANTGLSVLLVFAAEASQIQAMLQAYPDLAVVDFFDASYDTPTIDLLSAYDAVVVGANYYFADPVGLGNVLADYIDAGGAVVQTVPTFDPMSGWGIQGRFSDEGYSPFTWNGDWFSWADLGDFDPTHPIMDGVGYAGDYFRQMLETTTDSEWVASWTDDEFIVTKGSVVALNTFLPDGYGWSGDVPLIVHNSIVWLQTAGDVPWLSTAPITATVPALDSTIVQVTFDASVPEVAQPGEYLAELQFRSDTPYEAPRLPVTMTVSAPADWGRLNGIVSGLGYCDAPGAPLANATVEIIESGGATQSGADGYYVFWMPAGDYTVKISSPGYLPLEFAASILAGGTLTQDVDLRLDRPCLAAAPDSFEVTVPQDAAFTATLQLNNGGAGTLNAQTYESLLALSLPAARAGQVPLPVLNQPLQTGPASVRILAAQTLASPAEIKNPLSGWFGGLDLPGGLVRYAYAQCMEQPESFYVFGGVDGSFNVSAKSWRYDATGNTWTQLADLPMGSEAPSAACYAGKIYVMGGGGGFQMYIYDIANDSWSEGAALPRGVEGAAAAAWDGKIYLVGGDDDFYPYSGVSDEVNIYAIASDSWQTNGAPLPVATSNAGFAQLGPYLYVVGGWDEMAPSQNVTATLRYDIEADSWMFGPKFQSGRADFALAATDSSLYALGGDEDGNGFFDGSDAVEQLDLPGWDSTAEWLAVSDSLPAAVAANNAGFCTSALANQDIPEIWSVGGLDPTMFAIGGRTFFRESPGERCYSIYQDIPWLAVSPAGASVAGDSDEALDVVFDATGLALGEYQATLALVTNDPAAPLRYLPVTLTVIERSYGLTVSPAAPVQQGAPGAVISFTLEIMNSGNVADTFDVTLGDHRWVVNTPLTVGPVPANSAATLIVTVQIPAEASGGSKDIAVLTISSHGDPLQAQTVNLTSLVMGPYKMLMPVIRK